MFPGIEFSMWKESSEIRDPFRLCWVESLDVATLTILLRFSDIVCPTPLLFRDRTFFLILYYLGKHLKIVQSVFLNTVFRWKLAWILGKKYLYFNKKLKLKIEKILYFKIHHKYFKKCPSLTPSTTSRHRGWIIFFLHNFEIPTHNLNHYKMLINMTRHL